MMKSFRFFLLGLSFVSTLSAQTDVKTDTIKIKYGDVYKSIAAETGYRDDIAGYSEKYIYVKKYFGGWSSKHIHDLTLDCFDKATMKFEKNIKLFEVPDEKNEKKMELHRKMTLHSIRNVENKLYVFTEKKIENKKKKNETVLYRTILDENGLVTESLKELMSLSYEKSQVVSFDIIEDEDSKQMIVIGQGETESDQNIDLSVLVFDTDLKVLEQGIVTLPIKATHKKGTAFVNINNEFIGDGNLYSSILIPLNKIEKSKNDEGEQDFINTLILTNLSSKKSTTLSLKLKEKNVYDMNLFFIDNKIYVAGSYSEYERDKDDNLHGFFVTSIDKEVGNILETKYFEFKPKQISLLADANNLLNEKDKKKDTKAERVSTQLKIVNIFITNENEFILITEYRKNYSYSRTTYSTDSKGRSTSSTVTYYNSLRGNACLFNIDMQAQEITNFKVANRYKALLDYDGSCYYTVCMKLFNSKKESKFNILDFNSYVFEIDLNSLEYRKKYFVESKNTGQYDVYNLKTKKERKRETLSVFIPTVCGDEIFGYKYRDKVTKKKKRLGLILSPITCCIAPVLINANPKNQEQYYCVGKVEF